jgi:bifunctional N-acetylglucosamine-1-phosphate-uridyltransferase/glucosamine-1-phosphate-acetyltransferase GlmU-like protein
MNMLELYAPDVLGLVSSGNSEMKPWEYIDGLPEILRQAAKKLGSDFEQRERCLIHRSATVHPTAILQDIVIVEANASIGPHAMLRGGVWLGEDAHIGGSCEIKQSVIGLRSAVAHLNYVGNSIVGSDVNIEAGAVLANHFNEYDDKTIWVLMNGSKVKTGVKKFGALVGDRARIGANAVTTPGTILKPGTIVGRLELVRQID